MATSIELSIGQGDVKTFKADVLALKHAQAFHGADRTVSLALEAVGIARDRLRVLPGEYRLVGTRGALQVPRVLFVGVPPLGEFTYRDIQSLARDVLTILAQEAPQTQHLVMNVHGPGAGLDEKEAVQAQVLGYIEALQSQQFPESLKRISIISQNAQHVEVYRRIIEQLSLGPAYTLEPVEQGLYRLSGHALTRQQAQAQATRIDQAAAQAEDKPHVFVAMPFDPEYNDLYYYGIRRAVEANDLLCVRVDRAFFIGDIPSEIFSKIESAALVIADLTGAKPNVYLEVGYAWGKGRPTILMTKDVNELQFDVKSMNCIVYDSIHSAEVSLTEAIQQVRAGKGV